MESSSSTPSVNVVFYAESEEAVKALASQFLSESNGSQYNGQYDGANVNGYIRFPGQVATVSPHGVTDVLVVQVSGEESEHFETVKNYVDKRRAIPSKFLVSSNDLTEVAKSFDAHYLSEVSAENVLQVAVSLEKSLRDTFNQIDANKNGYIDANEIKTASEALGHALNTEDAKEIAESLSTNGQVSFEKFKQWWVRGRTDFNSFRRVLKIESTLSQYVKTSSEQFKDYLNHLQAKPEANSEVRGKINISPSQDFDLGAGLSLHLTLGNDYAEIAKGLTQQLRENPASFGVELKLKNAEDGPQVVETLNSLKEMANQMAPQIFESGVEVNFRVQESSVFVDVSYGGIIADQISGVLSVFNFSALNFVGGLDLHLTTKLRPSDVLTQNTDVLFQNLFNLKFEGNGEATNLKTLVNLFINTFTSMNQGNVPKEIKYVFLLLKAYCTIKKVDFNFQYDPLSIFETFVDMTNANYAGYQEGNMYDVRKENFPNEQKRLREKLGATLRGVLGSVEPFKPALLSLDLDHITLYAVCPLVRLFGKVSLKVKGVTDLLHELSNEQPSEEN